MSQRLSVQERTERGFGDCGPLPGEGGRPPIVFDYGVVERMASLGCTVEEVAVALGITRETVYARCRTDPQFAHAYSTGKEMGRTTLRRLQWRKANEGSDTMLIWLGKQILNQKDRQELTGADGENLVIEVVMKGKA